MTAVTRPRGPLPARVYWTRRLLVVAVAFALVFGIAHLLGGGGSSAGGPSARPVAADPSTASSTPGSTLGTATVPSSVTPTPSATVGPSLSSSGRAGKSATATPLAAPSGTCENSDVLVVPSVESPAYAGSPVLLTMTLTTKVTPACNWVVSPASVVIKVTSGADRFWSTQQCGGAVPKQSVVVRRDSPTTVRMAWNGQRSDSDCTRATAWAQPGYYHAVAAALGSEPSDEQFRLLLPPTPTRTAEPTPRAERTASTNDAKSTESAAPTKSSKPGKTAGPTKKPGSGRH